MSKATVEERNDRFTIGAMMLLTAGAALGLWLGVGLLRGEQARGDPTRYEIWFFAIVYLLGGLSMAGCVILLIERLRRRDRRPWRSGKLMWFAHGTASWLLWPPIVYGRFRHVPRGDSMSEVCYLYGTPLMALYVVAALATGGRLRRNRRRCMRRSWGESFGLVLGLIWACTGLYVLSLLYEADFFGRR